MNAETRACQNCKADFTIEPDDFGFYERMKVPAPTWCPDCRLLRRYAWRNERTLYHTTCANCKKNIFSAYPPEGGATVFCHECWNSDAWDPMDHGRDYDFSRPFFEQWHALLMSVPRVNLFQINTVNSPYGNIVLDSKDCYLSFSVVGTEAAFYSKNIDRSRFIFDSLNVMDSEHCYWNIYGTKNYNVRYSLSVRSCLESAFLFDCVNSRNCFMSSGLRNGEYVFYNKQLDKNSYDAEMAKINTGSRATFKKLVDDFHAMLMHAPHRYASIVKCIDSTGDVLSNTKNAKNCFEGYELENVKHCARIFGMKDMMDVNNTGIGSELMYEYVSGGKTEKNLRFSIGSFGAQVDCTYTGWCGNSSNLWGCFGLKGKQYCILNKQYSEEEYNALLPRIINHMNEMPYIGKNGRTYSYGEFFPIELSPFAYNGSVAHEHFPLAKDEVIVRGYYYREPDLKNPKIDIATDAIPDDIASVDNEIIGKNIGCGHAASCIHQCSGAFRITEEELAMYKKMALPLPSLCPNCRHYERLALRNPWKLWHRACRCAGKKSESDMYENTGTHSHSDAHCPNEFETSYAPERPEIVYCEECYQAEIM
jgi:hypothetical protein